VGSSVKDKLEEIIKKVATAEIGSLEAFVNLAQSIHKDESLTAFLKREKFWRFELSSLDSIMQMSKKERLVFLRNFIFKEKKQKNRVKYNSPFAKINETFVLGLCLQSFGAIHGLKMKFYQIGQRLTIKVDVEGDGYYIALDEEGRFLDTQEIMDALFDFGKLSPLDFRDVVLTYLTILQEQIDIQNASSQLLKIYDMLLALRQGDALTLLRRIYLLKDLGRMSDAMADLKRFLNFQPVTPVTSSLMKLYNQLNEVRFKNE
jgi:hypothetical protein